MQNTLLLVLRITDLLAMGLERRGEIKAVAENLSAQLRTILDEGRDPTEEEWAVLHGRIESAEDALDARATEAEALTSE